MLVKANCIKLYNTYNNDIKYVKIDESKSLEIQIEELLIDYKKKYYYAEIVCTYRLHSDTYNQK